MKKRLVTLFPVFFALVLPISRLSAQENLFVASGFNVNIPSAVSSSANAPNAVSEKIYTDFKKRFQNAFDVFWSTRENYTFAYFKDNGKAVRVTYKNDKLQYTIRSFYGDQVPVRISDLMKRNGYDMTITNVIEVKGRYTTTQFVKMEDAKSYTTVRVQPDGEMSVYETYSKSR
jgi:hypothetical protein